MPKLNQQDADMDNTFTTSLDIHIEQPILVTSTLINNYLIVYIEFV